MRKRDGEARMEEKIKISVDADGVKVIGNRRGLIGLAEICQQLAQLPENLEESRKLGNHYHYAEWMNNAEASSVPLEILYDPTL
jgi:hypothetical protein